MCFPTAIKTMETMTFYAAERIKHVLSRPVLRIYFSLYFILFA